MLYDCDAEPEKLLACTYSSQGNETNALCSKPSFLEVQCFQLGTFQK